MENIHVTKRLKALRTRAGLSMAQIATALGYGAASSYQRYEDENLVDDDLLQFELVKKLIPVLVGKGSPAITDNEVFALAGESIQNMLRYQSAMTSILTLVTAETIVSETLSHAKSASFKPLGIVVLDARGTVKVASIADGSSLARFDIARAKAKGALAFNMGTRALEKIARDRPHFFAGAVAAIEGGIVPVPGGVLIRDADGGVLGAVGVSGDTSDNDEAAALAGVTAAGLVGDGGQCQ